MNISMSIHINLRTVKLQSLFLEVIFICHQENLILKNHYYYPPPRGSHYGIVVKVLDYRIIVKETEFQLSYYIHFQIITHWKGASLLTPPAVI